ncbi:MAG: flagellar biosynthesis protein FlhB [Planctomycetes bacterium]|nr:flagellar biosynthesis protein FlhB [Planctomycetota bacterium]MCH7601737.1 flagellar biosynthesis protein FlhB [Planctomycetota bacterium]
MADDLGEKTEDATPRRLQEAREEGNVAKSQDLAGACILLVMTLTLWWATMHMLGLGKIMLGQALGGNNLGNQIDQNTIHAFVAYIGSMSVRMILPVLLIAWAVAALSHLIQVGWIFSPKSLVPKLSKLNPITGFKKIFGLSGLIKVTLDSLKVLILVIVAVLTLIQHKEQIVLLPYLTAFQGLGMIGRLMFDLALRALAVLLLLGLLDLFYQRWKYRNDMKMTKQQIKDEMKQTEGDPDVKRRRLRIQQQISMQRISSAVPKADVVVTNPEHISIAIQYDQEKMNAPIVVAKGADFLALRIRQIAKKNNIPVVERKPLARALYYGVEVGQEVPPEFYHVIAEILAYVFRLSGRMAG